MNINTALALIEETPVEEEKNKAKFITIELKCRAGATAASAVSYKKHIRLFEGGTPQEFVEVYRAIEEVWTQNNITTPADKINIVKMVVKGESFTTFEESITVQRGEGDLTNEMVDEAMDAIALATFPHRALFQQKRWMNNGMKKPRALTTRQTVAALTKMNNSLPYFPGATVADKFNEEELLQIMEWMVPNEFRQKFDEKGYIPTDHDRKRFIEECEIVERLQASRAKSTNHKPTNSQKLQGRSKNKNSDRKKKYCSHHGADKGHNSDECWTLHPELKPAPKGPRLSNNKMRKEINLLAKTENKSELEIVNHKIEQLQKAKASYEKRDKKKESHIMEMEEGLTDTDSESSHSSKSVRMMEVDQPIPKKKLTKVVEKKRKQVPMETPLEVPKKKKSNQEEEKKKDLFELVNPDEAARQKKIRAFKKKMGIIEDDDSFIKKAKKVSEEVDLSNE